MTTWLFVTVYFVVLLISLFIIIPFFVARNKLDDDNPIIIMGPIFWPMLLLVLFGWYIIVNPGTKLFFKSIKFFKEKPKEKIEPIIDAAKSTYRNTKFV